MGVYNYVDRQTGQAYNFTISGDAPSDLEFARMAQVLEQDRESIRADLEERLGREISEPDDGTAIGRGFARGKQQVKQAFGETLGTIGEQAGFDFLEDYGLGVEEAAQQRLGELSLQQPERLESTDVEGLRSALTYAGEVVGEQIPQLGLGLGAAAVGSALAPAAPFIAGATAAGLSTAPILFGNDIQRQEDEVAAGRKDRVDVSDALTATFGQATLEGISDKLLLGGLLRPLGKSIFTRTVSRAGGGAATEGLTEVGQQMMERAQAGLPIDSDDAIAEYREAAIAGGLIGGGVRATGIGERRLPDEPPIIKDDEQEVDTDVEQEVTTSDQFQEQLSLGLEDPLLTPQLREGQEQGELFTTASETTAAATEQRNAAGITPDDATQTAEQRKEAEQQLELDIQEQSAKAKTDEYLKKDRDTLQAEMLESVRPKQDTKVTKEMLDELGVFGRAPLRDKIIGKDVSDPEVQNKLRNYAKNSIVKNKVPELEQRVETLLGGLNDARPRAEGTGASTGSSQPSVDGSGRGDGRAVDTVEPTAPDTGPVGRDMLDTDGVDTAAGVQRDTLTEPEVTQEQVQELQETVEATVAKPVAPSSELTEAQRLAAERKRIRDTPGGYEAMVRNALKETGTRTPAEVLVEPDDLAARQARLAEGQPAPLSMPESAAAVGGAETGAAAQAIPQGVQVAGAPQVRGASVPQEQLQAVEAERDAAAQAGIDRIWNYNRQSQIAVREFHDTQVDSRSTPESTTALDKEGILELIKTPDTQLKNNAPAQAAKLFFKRFRRPVDALAEIGATRVDGPVQQSLEGEKVSGGKTASKEEDARSRFFYGPKEFKYYEGMTKPAAIQANVWVNNNLSRQARDAVREAKIAARVDPKDNRSDAYLGVVKAAKAIVASDARKVRKSLSRQEKGTAEAARRGEVQKQLEKQTELPLSLVAPTPVRLSSGQEIYRATPAKKGLSTIEALLTEQGFKRRKVRKNETVSEDAYTLLDEVDGKEVLYVYQDTRNDNELLTKEYHKEVVDDLEYSLENYGLLLADPVKGLDQKLLPSIQNAIQRGDMRFALNAISATSNVKRIRQIAAKLATVVGDTKVQVTEDLSQVTGRTAAGLFEPSTNTIYIDANRGMNVHTILHEMTHAATSAKLANPSLPETKQLQSIMDTIRDQFGEVYGTQNLDEFVAEAFSNPEFQRALALTRMDGGKISAWDRFVNAVQRVIRKLLGLAPKNIQSAMDEVDTIVSGMLAPSPATRAAPNLLLVGRTKQGAANLIQSAANLAPETSSKISDLGDVIVNEGVAPKIKSFTLDMLPVNILVDVAKKYIPFAEELSTIINNMSGALRAKSETLDSMLFDLHKWQRKNPERSRILNNIIPRSTYLKVDPSRTDPDHMKYVRESRERSAEYDQLRAEFTKLDEKGQQLYQQLRNYFQDTYDDIINALDARLDATIPDAEVKRNAFEQLRQMLQKDTGVIRPYFPLMRKGKYRLFYNAPDQLREGAPETFVEYYPTRRKAEQAMATAMGQGATDTQITLASSPMDFSKAPSTGFVRDMLQAVNIRREMFDVSEEGTAAFNQLMQDLVDLSLDAMPERSFMQNFRRRKGVRGFIGDTTPTGMDGAEFDAYTMLKEKGRDLNRQLVQIGGAAQLEKFKSKLKEGANGEGTPSYLEDLRTSMMADKMLKIANFASSPNVPQYSQVVNSLGFGMTMGLNFSSAAITFFDVAMSAMPILAGKHGIRSTTRAYRLAAKGMLNAPTTRTVMVPGPDGNPVPQEVNMGVAGKSHANYTDAQLDERFGAQNKVGILVKRGSDQGQFNQSMTQENLEVGRDAPMETFNKYSSFMFHHSERVNRETTLIAAYLLGMDKKRKALKRELTDAEAEQVAQEAINDTEFTLGGTAAAGRPIVAQSGIGNILFLFKRFAVSKYYMMYRLAKDAAASADPEERAAARAGMRNFLTMTALMAGAGGMPLMGAFGAIYNALSDDDEDDFDTVLRQTVGEGIYGGIVNEVLGADVASRISMNSLLYRAPIIDKDQSAFWTLIEQLGGPVVGVTLSVERGIKDIANGEFQRGVEAMAPAAIRNGLKAIRFTDEGALTRRGDAITEDINPYNIAMQGLGFAPQAYIQQMEANKNARRREDAINSRRSKLLRRRNMAIREGDLEELRRVEQDIEEYNRGLPRDVDTAKKVITADTKRRSQRTFQRTTANMRGGITTTETSRDILDQYDF